MRLRHHHVQVEAVLAQWSVRIPGLGPLEARPHRVLDLHAGVRVFDGVLDSLPLVHRSGMSEPHVACTHTESDRRHGDSPSPIGGWA